MILIKLPRLQLFEWEDYQWFPAFIRDGETDYLRIAIEKFNIYKPAFSVLKDLLIRTGNKKIIDLCSGGGGAITRLAPYLNESVNDKYEITLSDKYPNAESFEYIKQRFTDSVDYKTESIDVLDVPVNTEGVRVIFSAFHHFDPERAKKILSDAVSANKPIAIFEAGERKLLDMFGVLFTTPLGFFFLTPFMKPYKLSRFIFTYIIPLIPVTTIWDGIVSMFRMYHPHELLNMAHEVEPEKYEWKSERIPHGFNKVIYLTGFPKK